MHSNCFRASEAISYSSQVNFEAIVRDFSLWYPCMKIKKRAIHSQLNTLGFVFFVTKTQTGTGNFLVPPVRGQRRNHICIRERESHTHTSRGNEALILPTTATGVHDVIAIFIAACIILAKQHWCVVRKNQAYQHHPGDAATQRSTYGQRSAVNGRLLELWHALS